MAEEYEGCKYHSSGWWEKHPRADHPETQNTIPIFDIIFWQTEDATGLYRTFTYCPCLCEDEETQEQFNQLAIYLTDALIRGMAKMGILSEVDARLLRPDKGGLH
jgi:hypothetical protein